VPMRRGRLRLVGAMSGVMVAKMRAIMGRPKQPAKALAHMPARMN
jgi:hypothetical protein